MYNILLYPLNLWFSTFVETYHSSENRIPSLKHETAAMVT